MAGLVPAIRVFTAATDFETWMPGTRPGMTKKKEPYFVLFSSAVSPAVPRDPE